MKIAVIGSGISGLGAAYLLAQRYDVTLFESAPRLGGHAHTVTVDDRAMDTGFLVYNQLTYPNLIAFFKQLGVETMDSDMSLSVQVKEKNLEWSGANLNTVYGQRRNLLNPRFHRMLLEILRFGREAEAGVGDAHRGQLTLGEYLTSRQYSKEFCQDYLLPIAAAIWSTPEIGMLDYPAETFLRFFMNHQLLKVNDRLPWRTVKNGSIQYVNKAAGGIPRVFTNAPVKAVERSSGGVKVYTDGPMTFDKVVFATHAPVTRKILKNKTEAEEQCLSSFRVESNRTYLHSDQSFMPKRKRCWSSWNAFGTLGENRERKVSLQYYLNRLQPFLPKGQDYFVTLNPHREIANAHREFIYDHPRMDQNAILAQKEIPSIQGHGGVYFAGAWQRHGFHEDGLWSAVRVASLLDAAPSWASL